MKFYQQNAVLTDLSGLNRFSRNFVNFHNFGSKNKLELRARRKACGAGPRRDIVGA